MINLNTCSPVLNTQYALAFAVAVSLLSGSFEIPICFMPAPVPEVDVSNSEVETIFHIPVDSLLKTIAKDTDPNHNPVDGMRTFEYQSQIVWGASARMLEQIDNLLKS